MINGKETSLGDIASVQQGFAFKSSDFHDSVGVPVIKIKNIASGVVDIRETQFYPYDVHGLMKYGVERGDVLIAMTGSHLDQPTSVVGRVSLFKEPVLCLLNQRTAKIFPKDTSQCDRLFLYYYMCQEEVLYTLASNASGSANQANISSAQILGLTLKLHPLEEQKAIAKTLSSLDDKIDLLHQQNHTLDQMAETLYQQWFIETPSADCIEQPLSGIADYLNGLALQKFPSQEGLPSLPVVKIRELKQGITAATDRASLNVPLPYVINTGDVLFSWSGSLEVVIWGYGKGALNQHLFKVTSSKYPKWFYYLATKQHLPDFKAIASSKATTMGHIQRHHLDEATVNVPPPELMREYDGVLSPFIDKIVANLEQLRVLEQTRDTLLPKLMSGEVRVQTHTYDKLEVGSNAIS